MSNTVKNSQKSFIVGGRNMGKSIFNKQMFNNVTSEGTLVLMPKIRFDAGANLHPTNLPTFTTVTSIYLVDRHAVIDVEYTSYRHVHPAELTDDVLSCKMEDIERLFGYYDRIGIEPLNIDWDGKAKEYNLLEEELIRRGL